MRDQIGGSMRDQTGGVHADSTGGVHEGPDDSIRMDNWKGSMRERAK